MHILWHVYKIAKFFSYSKLTFSARCRAEGEKERRKERKKERKKKEKKERKKEKNRLPDLFLNRLNHKCFKK